MLVYIYLRALPPQLFLSPPALSLSLYIYIYLSFYSTYMNVQFPTPGKGNKFNLNFLIFISPASRLGGGGRNDKLNWQNFKLVVYSSFFLPFPFFHRLYHSSPPPPPLLPTVLYMCVCVHVSVRSFCFSAMWNYAIQYTICSYIQLIHIYCTI